MEVLSSLPVAPSKMDVNRSKRPQSSRLRHKIDDTYSYFTRKVDPIIAACVANFLFRQPMDILAAMKLYFHNLFNVIDRDCFLEVECYLPKKAQKIYFTHNLGPQLSKIVDAIATSQPADVLDFICRFLMDQKSSSGIIVPIAAPISIVPKAIVPIKVESDHSSTARNKINDAISMASKIENNPTQPVTSTLNKEHSLDWVPNGEHSAGDKPKEISPITAISKSIQISIIGMGGGGKTSIINALQGNFSTKMKPSLGFKPTTMQLGENINVRFYDLGGGKKIRDIWVEYYHDVHAIIYVFDASLTDSELNESVALFQSTMKNPFLQGKPLLVLANKQDKKGALSSIDLSELLQLKTINCDSAIIEACSSFISSTNQNIFTPTIEDENALSIPLNETLDPRLESALESFLSIIQKEFPDLDTRVTHDFNEKKNLELKKRFERERKVLKNKIASAFRSNINVSLLPENLPPLGEDDSFTRQEGIAFIAGEIGAEIDSLEEVRTIPISIF